MEKTYISPDIIVVEMENNLMDVVSQYSSVNAADDSGNKTEGLGTGNNNGTSDVPLCSKDNGFDPWSTWDDWLVNLWIPINGTGVAVAILVPLYYSNSTSLTSECWVHAKLELFIPLKICINFALASGIRHAMLCDVTCNALRCHLQCFAMSLAKLCDATCNALRCYLQCFIMTPLYFFLLFFADFLIDCRE